MPQRAAWLTSALALFVLAAQATGEGADGILSLEELKERYLDCEVEAFDGPMDFGQAAVCSHYYEELKDRAFGGEFDRIRTWTDEQLKGGLQT